MHAQPAVTYQTRVNGHLVTLELFPDGHAHATAGTLTISSQEPKQALAGLLACPPFHREHGHQSEAA